MTTTNMMLGRLDMIDPPGVAKLSEIQNTECHSVLPSVATYYGPDRNASRLAVKELFRVVIDWTYFLHVGRQIRMAEKLLSPS
jgi:hypothetical protein